MKNNNRFFQQFKQWGLKVSVSSIIFVSVVMLGGVIITLALPSSLDEVKSSNADQQLTAENWDYLVDQVKSTVNDITTLTTTTQTDVSGLSDRINALDGTVGTNTTNIADLSGKVSTNTTNISNLSGKLATLSGNVTTLLSSSSSSLRAKNGNNIYYTSGNVGVGIIPNTSYALSTISLYIP
ncbi:MAG: hypothetical protein LBG59_03955 [Candidatus Peribacteria bacterium]|jgi:peptidoglycan hydrolase CwlO-like protein|nr:hypothetical protein [Candidatus Peribacteria bacterium]